MSPERQDEVATGPEALDRELIGSGTPLALNAATPLRLDRCHEVFLVRQGSVDLFSVALVDGEPGGVRRHLVSLQPGRMFMGFPAGTSHTLLAVGALGCQVRVLPISRFSELPAALQAQLIEQWVLDLSGPVFGNAPAWPDISVEPGSDMDVAAGRRLYAARGVAWVQLMRGRVGLADGAVEFGAGPECAPLADGLCALAADAATVRVLSTAQAVECGGVFDGLARFHAAALRPLQAQLQAQEQDSQLRLDARAEVARASMGRAIGRLSGVLAGQLHAAPVPAAGPPLAIVFARVAATLGIELPTSTATEGGETAVEELSIPALARASGIGIRDVLLREGWWRQDGGPVIAHRQHDGVPVAVLPDGRGGYRLGEAGADSDIAVDAKLAAGLSSQAVMLYRPLPAQLHRIADLARFSLQGGMRDLGALAAAGLCSGLLAALVPVATGFIFQWIIPRAELRQLPAILIGLVLAAVGAAVFDLTKAIAVLRVEGRMESILQPALMHRLLALPVRFFRGYGVGDLTDRVLGVQRIRQLIAGSAFVSLLSGLFSLVSFAVILCYSVTLALLAAALGLLAMCFTLALAYAQLRQERMANELRGREDGLVVQLIQGIAKIRVSGGASRLFAVWTGLFTQRKARILQAQRYASGRGMFYGVYPLLCSLILFAVTSRLLRAPAVGGDGLSLGGFVAVFAAFGQLLGAMNGMANALTAALEALPLFERLRPLVEAAPEQRAGRGDPGPLNGAIEVSHVSFRYVTDGPLVLDDVSLLVEPGQFVAIVGSSGSGKSTLLRLLLGFEMPESGDILYQGRSSATLDQAALRRRMGVVMQNGRITTGSIFDNITGGLPYTQDEVWAAARMAGLEADIQAMPMGLHTLMIEGVSTFSGGQYQRLMIARALIGKPQLLLFDEATSALDNASQALVTASLDRLRATRVVIAHRLSTVRSADCIHVLEGGRLVESGNYDNLMARDGAFSALARRQLT